MTGRHAVLYYAWSRPDEVSAPLSVIENRFPALFESRRMWWPTYCGYSDANRFDQGIGGFLNHVLRANFTAFVQQVEAQSGNPVREVERTTFGLGHSPLDEGLLARIDTLIVISFDSALTGHHARAGEIAAVRRFLDDANHSVFRCPHHDIGDVGFLPRADRLRRQEVEFCHHGDRTIPPQQSFGDFGRSLLAGLGVPVKNRFGPRPAAATDGTPVPIETEATLDRFHLLDGVTTFNLQPHLPHYERIGNSSSKLDVLARQVIDPSAPVHPFVQSGHRTFDALLQSRPDVFPGRLLVCDATLWSSTAEGVESRGGSGPI
jgi:hypothetical protein